MALRTPPASELLGTLSMRQREVLALIARGHTNGQVANALGISLDTAKYHVGEILNKLNVGTREEAAEAWRAGRSPLARPRRWAVALVGLPIALKVGAGAVAAAALAGVATVVILAGDGDPLAQPAPTATPAGGWPGTAPQTTEHILAFYPGNGGSIAGLESQTRTGLTRTGICFDASLANLPETLRGFRMSVDGVDVTAAMTWYVRDTAAMDGAAPADDRVRGCYTTTSGIPAGRHRAEVVVRDPTRPTAAARERVAWDFEVLP